MTGFEQLLLERIEKLEQRQAELEFIINEKQLLLIPIADKKQKVLFENSTIGDFEVFKKKFGGVEYSNIDLYYYYDKVKTWSRCNGKGKEVKRVTQSWVTTVKKWMERDNVAGKLKLIDGNLGQNDFEYRFD